MKQFLTNVPDKAGGSCWLSKAGVSFPWKIAFIMPPLLQSFCNKSCILRVNKSCISRVNKSCISRVNKSYISRQAFHNKQHLYLSLTVPSIHQVQINVQWLMILKANVKRPWMGASGRQIGFLMPPFCRSGQALPNHTWPMTPVWDWEVFALLMMVPVRQRETENQFIEKKQHSTWLAPNQWPVLEKDILP